MIIIIKNKGIDTMKPYIVKICLVIFLSTCPLLASIIEAQKNTTDDWHKHHKHENVSNFNYDGMIMEAVLTNDFLANVSGGLKQDSTILGNIDLTVEFDSEKLNLWKGGTFFAYILGNYSSNQGMTNYAGDFQTSSNIEAPQTMHIYELWYQHEFSDKFSILFGLHDYNSEFDVLEYGALFINSSFGIEPEISQVTPSIFPNTALTLRVSAKLSDRAYILATLNDGVVGNPNNDKVATVEWRKDDGFFSSVEIGISENEAYDANYYKLAIGSWYHSAKTENFAGIVDDKNGGVYIIGEKSLYSYDESVISAFFQVGVADQQRNVVGSYIGIGITYKGLFPNRNKDILGLAVANAITSKEYRNFSAGSADVYESTIELTYELALKDWFVVQPDIEYIINPSMDNNVENALIVGVRVTLSY